MKKEISPPIVIALVVIAVLIVAVVGLQVWNGPSTTPAVSGKEAEAAKEKMKTQHGGPPPDALKQRDEYYRTHPDAKGSR